MKSNGDAKEKNILQYVNVLFKLSHYNIPQLNRRWSFWRHHLFNSVNHTKMYLNFSYCFYFPLGNFPRSGFRIFNYLGPSRTEKGLIQNLGSGAFILVYVSLMFTTNIEYHCCNVNHHGNRHKYMRLIVGLNILFSALIFEYRFCAAMATALPLRVIRRSFNARSVQPK